MAAMVRTTFDTPVGDRRELDFPLDWNLAGYGRRVVLETLRDVAPYGRVVTYGELARRSGRPGGAGRDDGVKPLVMIVDTW
jgi:methylated-DNA-[protein]-cysteine S-methyltransferase